MGRDKATLVIGGQTLLGRAVDLLRSLSLPVTVVLNAEQDFPSLDLPIIRDRVAGRGPLGGLYTALKHTRARFNYVVACDLPLLPVGLMSKLKAHLQKSDIVVPADSHGQSHPLCAVYSRRCLGEIEAQLSGPDLSLLALLSSPRLTIHTVPPAEHGYPDWAFLNLNAPEDLQRMAGWQRLPK